MRLSNARLCLDCDEVHDEAQCPVCASESFAFIKRWVTTPEKRTARPPAAEKADSETVATYRALLASNGERRLTAQQILRGGVGLAVLGAAGWILQKNLRSKTAERSTTEPATTEPATRDSGRTPDDPPSA